MNNIKEETYKDVVIIGDQEHDTTSINEIRTMLTGSNFKIVPLTCRDRKCNKLQFIFVLTANTNLNEDNLKCLNKIMTELLSPIIVVYPNFLNLEDIHKENNFTSEVLSLWRNVPIFLEEKHNIPVLHIPKKELLHVLEDKTFLADKKLEPSDYYLIRNNTK